MSFTRRALLASACLVLLALPVGIGVVRAQSPPDEPRFEAAAIKPAPDGGGPFVVEMTKSYLFHAMNATLKQLVMFAYDLPSNQVTGGPGWFEKLHFDVNAKGAPPPPENPNDPKVLEAAHQRFRLMVRALLEDRFQLKAHRSTNQLPVYNLVVARRGSKLKEAVGLVAFRSGLGRLSGNAVTTEQLARILSQQLGRPVVNRTGLDKTYDFDLSFTPDRPAPNPIGPVAPSDSDGPSLFTALQEQLGLRLESAKEGVEVLVVDSAMSPSEN